MEWTQDSKRSFYTPDTIKGLPPYKVEALKLYTQGFSELFLRGLNTEVIPEYYNYQKEPRKGSQELTKDSNNE